MRTEKDRSRRQPRGDALNHLQDDAMSFRFRCRGRYRWFFVALWMFGREEDLNHEDRCSNHNRTISDVEVGPDVLSDVELEEVHYMSGENAIPEIAQCPTQN